MSLGSNSSNKENATSRAVEEPVEGYPSANHQNSNGGPNESAQKVEHKLREEQDAIVKEADELKAHIEKLKNDHLYLRAEFDNYRRNVIKERSDLLKFGTEPLIVALVDVIDNFDRALQVKPTTENIDSFYQGVEMIAKEFHNVLKRFNVTEIECLGNAFDPTLHDALSSMETDEYQPGHICEVFKKPYKLHDRVVRHGQVVVAKEKSK